jgi:hypothetical protein
MVKNYLKVAYRNLLHNKLYAIVNILGMGAALAVGITAYLTHTYNHTFDAFHRNAGKIYRVKTVRWFNGQEQNWGIVPRPLAPALAANFPAVEHAVRLSRHAAAFRHGDNVFNETILHVDAEFFEMFDFPLKFGTAEEQAGAERKAGAQTLRRGKSGRQADHLALRRWRAPRFCHRCCHRKNAG